MGQPPGLWTDQAVLPEAKKEAKKIEAELLEHVDRGQHHGSSSRTVAEPIEGWLSWRQQVRPISPSPSRTIAAPSTPCARTCSYSASMWRHRPAGPWLGRGSAGVKCWC